ncbi:MAG TPA: hypothetical protein V6C85_36885 [Allocoleopsis sp.]
MVERPIKKSERQALAPKSDAGEEVKGNGRSAEERFDSKPSRSFQKKDRKKGRGKGKQEDSRPSSVNPALVRAPKPQKPKPPVIEETPDATSEDSVTETPQETTAED